MLSYDNIKEAELQAEIASKWTPLRLKAEMLAASYDRLGMDSKRDRVQDCGTFLQFAIGAEAAKLHKANFCRSRLCPLCQKRRSLKIYAQASEIMDYLDQHERCRYAFLTLTVRNCQGFELSETIDVLLKGFKWLSHKCPEWKRSILGSMRALEITRNPLNGTWHPHLHCILAVPSGYYEKHSVYWISQKRWSELWQKACGLDYTPVVFVQAVMPDAQRRQLAAEISGAPDKLSRADRRKLVERITKDKSLSIEYRKAVEGAAVYIAKGPSDYLGELPIVDEAGQLLNPYDVYAPNVIDDNVLILLSGLSHRRLISWTGCFMDARKQLQLDDAEKGDLVHVETEIRDDIVEAIVTYHWECGAYVQKTC